MSPGDRSGVEMLGVAVVGFIVVLVVFWFLTRIVF